MPASLRAGLLARAGAPHDCGITFSNYSRRTATPQRAQVLEVRLCTFTRSVSFRSWGLGKWSWQLVVPRYTISAQSIAAIGIRYVIGFNRPGRILEAN